MKKIITIVVCAAGLVLSANSCKNFLETSNPGIVDADFVFSSPNNTKAAMTRVYDLWRAAAQAACFGDGLYYALDVAGSDMDRHPEGYLAQPLRHVPEQFYVNGTETKGYNIDGYSGGLDQLYKCIAAANNVINAMAASAEFENYMAASEPTQLSQMYGEAVCARATCYRELIKYFGDVPFTTKSGVPASGIAPRDSIYEFIIADLEKVAPHMYRIGSVPGWGTDKNVFSRTYAEALIGRLCLDAAGYQTRRADLGSDFYKGLDGKTISFETKGKPNVAADGAVYGRRSDYKDFYTKAQKYFKAVIDNPGSAVWHATDPRSTSELGQVFDNPYQYFFQQNNDLVYADESIYEYAQTWNNGNDARPYSYGRVSNGGSKNAFPCKNYGQGRINPAFYWGVFDPSDKRRDVSVCVTGSSGAGAEVLIPFKPNSKASGGGLTYNKWDENRMSNPNCLAQRKSGINGPYMRIAEVYLGYAETCAVLGQDAEAKQYLTKVRERSFPAGKADVEGFIASRGSLLKAIVDERAFEYAGEGDRRWTLIRTGLIAEVIRDFKVLQEKMIDGIAADGYYRFENGNEISAYVWTKLVNAKSLYGHRLTTQTPAGKEDDPVLYPGWRGQNDDWAKAGAIAGVTEANIKSGLKAGDNTNLAIKGLFKHIEPGSKEALDLEADGYTKVAYGIDLVTSKDEYVKYFFNGYDYESAPIYLWPFNTNQLKTIANISNGYGLPNIN